MSAISPAREEIDDWADPGPLAERERLPKWIISDTHFLHANISV